MKISGIFCSDEVKAKRLAICRKCENLRPGPIETCNLCGCFMGLKAKIVFSECPAGKWGMEAA